MRERKTPFFSVKAGGFLSFFLRFLAVVVVCFLVGVNFLHAATITSTATGGNWGTGGTWVGGVVPATTDNVVIATTGANNVTVNTSARTCVNLTINSGATLVCTTIGLTVNGAWQNNGTFTQGTATVTFGGTCSVNNGTGTSNFNNVALASGANFTVNDAMTVAGTFVFPTAAANTSATISGTNSLDITGAVTMPRPNAGFTCTMAVGAGTLSMGSLTMQATTIATGTRTDILTISTGTCTIIGTVTLSGTTGSIITFTGPGSLYLGNTVSAGPPTITPSTGTIIYNRAGVQTPWATTYNNLTLGGSGAKTIGAVTVNGILSMEGTCTASAAPTYGANASLRYNRSAAQAAGAEWPATFTAGRLTGGVIIDNIGDITANAAKTLGTGMPLTIQNGAGLNMSTFLLTLNDDLVNNGGDLTGSGGVTITGTAGQSIGAFTTTGTLSCTKTGGTATMTGSFSSAAITINGTGGTFNLGTGLTHNASGVVTLTAGSLNGGSSRLNLSVVSATAWGGTGTIFTPGTGTINFSAAGNQTLSATGTKTFYNLTFSGSGTKTNASTTVNNIFSLEGTATPSAAPTYGSAATLRYNTGTGRTAGAEWLATFAATGGVIIDNTGAITINAAKVFSAGSPLTIMSGATLTTGSSNITFNDDFINNGTWTASTGNVTLSGTTGQSIGSFNTTGLLLMSKTGGSAVMTDNSNAGSFTLNGTGGTLDLGAGFALVISGAYTSTSGTIQGSSGTLTIGGTVTASGGSLIPGTSTVNLTGAGAQDVPAYNYYNLVFSGVGTKTLIGTTTINNVVTLNSPGILDLGAATLNLAAAGTPFVNNGTLIASTSTVNYTSTSPATIAAANYNNLNGTGGDRLFATNANIGIAGVFTPGAGTYTVAGSTAEFNGTGNQDIPAFTFDKLIVSNAGIKKIAASVTVACQAIDINDNASVEINADGGGRLNVLQ